VEIVCGPSANAVIPLIAADAGMLYYRRMRIILVKARLLPLILLVAFALPSVGQAQTESTADLPRLLQALDYVAVDYREAVAAGAVINEFEYAEMREFAGAIRDGIGALQGAAVPGLARQAGELTQLIDAKADPERVFDTAVELRAELLRAFPVTTLPVRAPDPALGAKLYAEECGSCHGEQGRGDGNAGRGLDPAPTDFTDRSRARTRSLYGLYNTITLGVADTGMVPFAQLTDHERWSLTFRVARFQDDPALVQRGADVWESLGQGVDAASLMTLTETELGRTLSDAPALLAYLREHPESAFTSSEPLDIAAQLMEESLGAARAGDTKRAYALAVRAYLEGIELVEPALRAADARVVRDIENAMIGYRDALRGGAPLDRLEVLSGNIHPIIGRARELLSGGGLSPAVTFASSFIILAREGMEAILLIAAMALYLRRAGGGSGMTALHGGWIAALVAGALTWASSNWIVTISGAARELTEGFTALLAAVVLIWVGVWMHQQASIRDWTKTVTGSLSKAVKSQSLWWVFLLAFLAVYREAFETILFYQALWLQMGAGSDTAFIAGAALALVALLAAIGFIIKLGARLPIRQFFLFCSVTLVVLAVIFVGKGIAALQEAGRVPLNVVSFPRIDWLGVFPSAEGLAAQSLFALTAVVLLYRRGRKARA
jgi:high-affinity iron transporter